MRAARLIALGHLVGCSQVLGVDEFSVSATETQDASAPHLSTLSGCGNFPYGEPACGACVETRCCNEATACGSDSVCDTTQDCYAKCAQDDADCRGTCNSKVPYDVPAERKLQQCVATNCAQECDVACGGLLPRERGRAFRARVECCAAEKAMWTNDDAYKWQECQTQCFWPQLDSRQDADDCECLTDNPGAGDTARVLARCSIDVRATTAPDWSCVGQVSWPGVDAQPPLVLSMHVVDFVYGYPIPETTVKACPGYGPCDRPLSSGVTNEAGYTKLEIGRRLPSSNEYLVYLLLNGPTIPETLLYFNSPAPVQQSRFDARAALPRQTVEGLYRQANVVADPGRGSIGVLIRDCSPIPAAGIMISEPEGARVVYGSSGGGVDTAAKATSTTGQAIILNVAPGMVNLGFELAGDPPRQVAQAQVEVRAGAVTIVVASPSP